LGTGSVGLVAGLSVAAAWDVQIWNAGEAADNAASTTAGMADPRNAGRGVCTADSRNTGRAVCTVELRNTRRTIGMASSRAAFRGIVVAAVATDTAELRAASVAAGTDGSSGLAMVTIWLRSAGTLAGTLPNNASKGIGKARSKGEITGGGAHPALAGRTAGGWDWMVGVALGGGHPLSRAHVRRVGLTVGVGRGSIGFSGSSIQCCLRRVIIRRTDLSVMVGSRGIGLISGSTECCLPRNIIRPVDFMVEIGRRNDGLVGESTECCIRIAA
jgi:hypothetical protein